MASQIACVVLALLAVAFSASIENTTVSLLEDDTDVSNVTKSCFPRDTCQPGKADRIGDGRDWRERNCFCDKQCAMYGDCCADARLLDSSDGGNVAFECVHLRQFGRFYMRAECADDWQDETIRSECESSDVDERDVLRRLPATHLRSGITYRSLACAACNNVDVHALRFWKLRLECSGIPSATTPERQAEIMKRLQRNANGTEWGILHDNVWRRCSVDPVLPDTLVDIVRPCQDWISTCPVDWPDDEVASKCSSYTAVVYRLQVPYRNVHCAYCNGVDPNNLYCSLHGFTRTNIAFNDFSPVAFAALLDVEDARNEKCNVNELYDPFFKKCRDVLCGGRGVNEYRAGHCVAVNKPTENIKPPSDDEVTTFTDDPTSPTETTTVVPTDVVDNVTLNCPRFVLAADEFELEVFGNATVAYVPKYDRRYDPGEFIVTSDGQLLICVFNASTAPLSKFGPILGYATLAGLGVSLICLMLHLITFALVPELRNLSGKNLASLCVALLAAYSLFIAGQWIEPRTMTCTTMAVCTYYFFLVAFVWMLMMAFDVWRTLRLATSELRLTGGAQEIRFLAYSLCSWVVPALIVAGAVVVDLYPSYVDAPESLRPQFGENICWFSARLPLVYFFALPLAITMTCNLLFFIDSARLVVVTTKAPPTSGKAVGSWPARRNLRLYVRMALIMGLTWVAGLVATALDFSPLWYLFVALNTLQGLFVFLAFTCTKKVSRALKGRVACFGRRKGRKVLASWSWSAGSAQNNPRNVDDGSRQKTPTSHPSTSHTSDTMLVSSTDGSVSHT